MDNLNEKTNMQEAGSYAWENEYNHSTNGRITMAQIFDVDPAKRTASIKTFGSDPMIANSDWTDIQWLDTYGSLDGDEISFIPRIGSLCLAVFTDGMPWIIGFFKPASLDPDDEPPDPEGEGILPSEVAGGANFNREKINAGDLIWRTIGNCRLVLRSGGEIEIESTKICKRTMFPSRNLITDLCRNYEFRCDGGTIDWVDNPDAPGKTISEQVWRDDFNGTNIVKDTKGTVEKGSDVIHRYEVKPGTSSLPGGGTVQTPEDLPFIMERYNTGKTEVKMNGLKYTTILEADGDYTLGIGDYKFYTHIQPTGEMQLNINNNFDLSILDTGETTLNIGIEASGTEKKVPPGGTGKFNLNIKPDGSSALNIADKIKMDMKSEGSVSLDVGPGKSIVKINTDGETSLTVQGNLIKISPSGEITIESKSKVDVKTTNVSVEASAKIEMKSPLIVLNNQGSGILTANGTQNVVDFITGVPVIPSPTIFGDV